MGREDLGGEAAEQREVDVLQNLRMCWNTRSLGVSVHIVSMGFQEKTHLWNVLQASRC